jgi:hypothetical protein
LTAGANKLCAECELAHVNEGRKFFTQDDKIATYCTAFLWACYLNYHAVAPLLGLSRLPDVLLPYYPENLSGFPFFFARALFLFYLYMASGVLVTAAVRKIRGHEFPSVQAWAAGKQKE